MREAGRRKDSGDMFVSDRELAYQIADQFRVFGKHIGLKDTVVVGGVGESHLCDSQVASSSQLVYRYDETKHGTFSQASRCSGNPG